MSDAVHLFTSNSSVTVAGGTGPEKIFNGWREAQSKRTSNSFASTVLIPADPLERGEGRRIGPGNGGRTNQSLPRRKMGGEGGRDGIRRDRCGWRGEERGENGWRKIWQRPGEEREKDGGRLEGGDERRGWMYVMERGEEREVWPNSDLFISLPHAAHSLTSLSLARFGL